MEDVADGPMRELLQETGWLRRLARSMVNDSATADDLAQDAWIVASRKAPTDGRPLRPWLSRVMLNLVRMRHRGARRRDAREQQAPDPGGTATPEELYERVEMQRVLAEVVLALKPIYRDVVLMHFVEGRTSAEIGEALHIDAGTVRWRLKTAIEQMRAALDRRSSDKRALWIGPMARLAGGESSSFGGVALAIVAAAVLALVLGVVVILHARSDDGASRTASGSASGSGVPHAIVPSPLAAGTPGTVPAWAPQPGVAGKHIAGVVMANGVPVGGARVLLHMIHHDEQPIRDIVTAPDGTFDLGVQPAVSYMLGASAPGRVPALVEVDLREATARDHVVLELADCISKISGIVSDASGSPIAHATLRLDKIIGTESDGHGHYELCLQTKHQWIVVGADGYAMTAFDVRVYGAVTRNVMLVPEGTIVGKVVTPRGTPVPNARVEVQEGNDDAVGLTVMTRDDGTYQASSLAGGEYRLGVDAPDLIAATQPIVVRAGEVTTAPTIVLRPALTVRGRVLLDGVPVADVHVRLHDQDRGVVAVSQADGSFTITGAAPGEQRVSTDHYRVLAPTTFTASVPTVPLTVSIARTASIAGRVLLGGKPVAGAQVVCVPLATSLDTLTGRDGAFVLENLDGRACDLSAFAVDLGRVSVLTHLTLAPGARQTIDVELVNGAAIDGSVVDESGAPVPNVFVYVESERGDSGEALTDATGHFHAPALINAATTVHLQVFATPSGGNAFPWAVTPAAIVLADGNAQITGVRLVIRRQLGTIRGRVIDETKRPVSDARVRVHGQRTMADNTGPIARTDRDGRFEIADLPVGAYRVEAAGSDGAFLIQEDVATGSDLTFVLVRAGAIEGTLVGFTSPTVVAMDHTRGFKLGALVTGTQFRTFGLTPGTYLITAAGGGSDTKRVEVRPGETVHVELASNGTARVDLVLTDHAAHAPLAGVDCVAAGSAFGFPASWDQPMARTDAAGKATIANAPSGKVRVMCFPNTGAMASAETDVAPNATATVSLVSVSFGPPGGDPGFVLQPFQLPIQVWHVTPRTPAAAQLAPGDELLAVDGEDVAGLSATSAQILIQTHAPGTSVALRIKRADVVRTVTLVLQRP